MEPNDIRELVINMIKDELAQKLKIEVFCDYNSKIKVTIKYEDTVIDYDYDNVKDYLSPFSEYDYNNQ